MDRSPDSASLLASERSRASTAIAMLVVTLFATAANMLNGIERYAMLGRIGGDDPPTMDVVAASDSRTQLLSVAAMVLFLATGVAFIAWVRRAYRVAREVLGGETLEHDPSAAGWSFVIPITNLWKPLGVMRNLVKASDPSSLPEPAVDEEPRATHYREAPAPKSSTWNVSPPLESWWYLFVASRLGSQWASRAALGTQPTVADVRAQAIAFLIVDVGSVAAAVLAILVVRAIDLQQHEKHRRLAAAQSFREEDDDDADDDSEEEAVA